MYLSQQDAAWAAETMEKIKMKMKPVTERSRGKIPYTTVDGVFDDRSGSRDISWWTNGFWGGMMWQLYALTGDELYRETAEELETKLDAVLMRADGLDHDNGFKWLPTAVADYRLTKNPESRNRALLAANNLAGRFNLAGNFIRAWNDWGEDDHRGWAIIDCMMNIPLLYWASEMTGDSRFKTIAMEHADTVLAHTIRPDGSCNHIVVFDPDTGEYLDNPGGQGYESGSSWSRGQSWAIYGMALSYAYTGEKRYLEAAKRTAHYFIANVSMNGYVPLVDFRAPEEPVLIDTSAGVIAACGLLEIASHVGEHEQKLYTENAVRIMRTLEEKYCDWDPENDAALGYGTGAYHGRRHYPIIYGDYFLLEGVLRLLEKEFLIW